LLDASVAKSASSTLGAQLIAVSGQYNQGVDKILGPDDRANRYTGDYLRGAQT